MPKKGQKRDLPQDLRAVFAENLGALMDLRGLSAAQMERDSGINHGTFSRIRNRKVAPTVDTIQAIAAIFEIEPWVLLMRGGVASMGKVFTTPVPDAKLGSNWTRPDRKPLLQSNTVKPSTKGHKIKLR